MNAITVAKSVTLPETAEDHAEEGCEDAGAHQHALRETPAALLAAPKDTSHGSVRLHNRQREDAEGDTAVTSAVEEATRRPRITTNSPLSTSRHPHPGLNDQPRRRRSLPRPTMTRTRETGNGGQGERPPPY